MSFFKLKFNPLLTVLLTLWCTIEALPPTEHYCRRECKEGDYRVCEYNFTIAYNFVLGANCKNCPLKKEDCNLPGCVAGDGVKRAIISINGRSPGPFIEVCRGDKVVVHANNQLLTEATAIHWHGMFQRWTPYMDGVAFVTQCPIHPSNTFTYSYPVLQKGTYFWHSHLGTQRSEGFAGALIAREPAKTNPHIHLYDYDLSEHVFLTKDTTTINGLEKFLSNQFSDGNNKPDNILINGKGRSKKFTGPNGETVYTPLERFVVKKGYRYRFRFINNGILNCPIEMSVDNHTLTVISFDAFDVKAVEAASVVTSASERCDVIINANQKEGVYWMRFKGLQDCAVNSVHQVAVLQYSTSSDDDFPEAPISYELAHKDGVQVNALNVGLETTDDKKLSIAHLRSVTELPKDLKGTPDFKYYVTLNVGRLGVQMNNITLSLPQAPILPYIEHDPFCNETTLANSNCGEQLCKCTHVVSIPMNALVEVILIDGGRGTINHPIHLHGFSFNVVGLERLNGTVNEARIRDLDKRGLLRRNFCNAPYKCVMPTPSPGYAIFRFRADNPGYWFMHCHLEFHTIAGMGLLFEVGEDSDMVPVPKGFPKCGNFNPHDYY